MINPYFQCEVRPESKVAGSRAMEDSPVTKKTINENYNIMKIKVEQESQQEHVTSIQSRPGIGEILIRMPFHL